MDDGEQGEDEMNEEEGEDEQDEEEIGNNENDKDNNNNNNSLAVQSQHQRKSSMQQLKKQLSLHSARGGMQVIGEDGAVAGEDEDEEQSSFDGMKTRQHNRKRNKKVSQDKADVLARTRQATSNAVKK